MNSSPSEKERDFLDYKKQKVIKERKTIERLITQSRLEQYLSLLDHTQESDVLYTVRGCDLESKLEEFFPYLKAGHRRRLGVIILEGTRILKLNSLM